VLLLVRLATSDEPEETAVRSAQSPFVSEGQVQQADITETPAAPVKSHPLAAKIDPPGRTFIAKLNLQPRILNGAVKGYVVRPDDPTILKGTPLQTGDVLLEVDGLKLDPARVALLAKNVGQYEDVFVRFERGSTEQEDMLPLGTR
jgi:type II secretory pathway component PulC